MPGAETLGEVFPGMAKSPCPRRLAPGASARGRGRGPGDLRSRLRIQCPLRDQVCRHIHDENRPQLGARSHETGRAANARGLAALARDLDASRTPNYCLDRRVSVALLAARRHHHVHNLSSLAEHSGNEWLQSPWPGRAYRSSQHSCLLAACATQQQQKAQENQAVRKRAAQEVARICALPEADRQAEIEKIKELSGVAIYCATP